MRTAEKKLWLAVLEQAFADAELLESGGQIRAQAYLRADSPENKADLSLVCEFADLPMDRVVPWARRRYPVAA
jgi:hypothetical protein